MQEVLEATLAHCDHQIEEVHLSLWLDWDGEDSVNLQNSVASIASEEVPEVGGTEEGRYRLDGPPSVGSTIPPPRFLEDPAKREESQRIVDVLTRCKGNRSRAAKELGISRVTLYKKLRYYGLVSGEEGPEASEGRC
jgi:transcriptional regulator of acetoin/glycerol metabolism